VRKDEDKTRERVSDLKKVRRERVFDAILKSLIKFDVEYIARCVLLRGSANGTNCC
jgi:hypothetical protein